ncbi:MAG: hypothetical protein HYS81_00310 [Candidatus Aenigmatarchaeota archaeon]|nr:MAG: hypothetical protein HYS81_00310 [Candidatus Aenigmarchaeota archaeon]
MLRYLVVLLLAVAFILAANEAEAQQQTELRLFVEASIGVSVEAPDKVTLNLGEPGGFFMTIVNEGNIRDKIRVEGALVPKNDWVDFAFACTGGLGECDSVLGSGMHTIDNIELTPEINSTTVFVEMEGWRKTSTFSKANKPVLALTGYSLTNSTKQSLKAIEVDVVDPNASFGPLAAPELNPYASIALMVLAGMIAYRGTF